MSKVNDLVRKELSNPTIDIFADYSNIAIDSITDNEILQNIPIVKTIVVGTNITLAIREKFFVKKLLVFLSEFHKGTINKKRFEEFRNKLDSDDKFNDKVTEVLTTMIERHVVVNQSAVMANLFKAHINGFIDWNRFNSLCIILEKLHPHCYQTLYEMSEKTNIDLNYSYWGSFSGKPSEDRGDIYKFNQEDEAMLLSSGLISPRGTQYSVSPLGKDLFKYGIIRLFKNIE